MFKRWLAKLLNIEHKVIVEVEKPRQLEELTPDLRNAVTSLNSHPGFNYLLAKLRLERSRLESALKYSKHETLEAVHHLQGGVYWAGWLERELVRHAHNVTKEIEQTPTRVEADILREIDASIERVGHKV